MYDMGNIAAEDMVCMHHGEAVWEQIKAKVGVEGDALFGNESCPDETTHLATAVGSVVLKPPPETFLGALGECGILYAAREGDREADAGGTGTGLANSRCIVEPIRMALERGSAVIRPRFEGNVLISNWWLCRGGSARRCGNAAVIKSGHLLRRSLPDSASTKIGREEP